MDKHFITLMRTFKLILTNKPENIKKAKEIIEEMKESMSEAERLKVDKLIYSKIYKPFKDFNKK